MKPFPFVLSIPHCGTETPPDLRDDMALSDRQVAESVDFGTRVIFSGLKAACVIQAHWSRLVTDLNRDPDDLGPRGVVARHDYHQRPVFKTGREPTEDQISARVAAYHAPYHRQIEAALRSPDIRGVIDCHSLNGTGPADAPDSGERRRDVTLSNFGDTHGRQRSGDAPLTCRTEEIQAAAAAFEAQGFSVSINRPYRGGYIVNHYAAAHLPRRCICLQIEMSQDLYMPPDAVVPDPRRLKEVAPRVEKALARWIQQVAG